MGLRPRKYPPSRCSSNVCFPALRRPLPNSRSPPSPTTTEPSRPGRCSSASPASRATATSSRLRRSRRARSRSSSSARWASASPRSASTASARPWLRQRPGSTGTRPTQLATVGVTGTNGKTTTAFVTRDLLEAGGRQTGLLGTVKSVIGGLEHEVMRTTPEAIDLQRTFREMLDHGDRACVMEVSSHALDLRRADAIHFAVAIFTNLTQDHLDFHPTMEDYFAAKRRLFVDAPRPPRRDQHRRSVRRAARARARRAGHVRDRQPTAGPTARSTWRRPSPALGFTAQTPDGEIELSSPLRGRFNVYNVLGAFAAARALDVPAETCGAGDRRRRAGAGPVPDRRRGAAVRRDRRLRAHAGLA